MVAVFLVCGLAGLIPLLLADPLQPGRPSRLLPVRAVPNPGPGAAHR